MDPTTTYNEMKEAYKKRRYRVAWNHYESLRDWLDRGGYAPWNPDVKNILEDIEITGERCAKQL